jgi:hypothetical protein
LYGCCNQQIYLQTDYLVISLPEVKDLLIQKLYVLQCALVMLTRSNMVFMQYVGHLVTKCIFLPVCVENFSPIQPGIFK